MATKTVVKDGAAQVVGFLAIGDNLAGDDDTRMDKAWDEVHDWLKNKGLDAFPTAGPVPDRLVPHIEFMLAHNVMLNYHVPPITKQEIKEGNAIAKRDLPGLILPDYESLEEPVDY